MNDIGRTIDIPADSCPTAKRRYVYTSLFSFGSLTNFNITAYQCDIFLARSYYVLGEKIREIRLRAMEILAGTCAILGAQRFLAEKKQRKKKEFQPFSG